MMPAFSMAENSALAEASLPGSNGQDLAKIRGPGWVRRLWQTGWQGREAVNLSEERTSGNSMSRLEIHLGVERRAAWKENVGGEEINVMAGEQGEEPLKTFWLATSRRRL